MEYALIPGNKIYTMVMQSILITSGKITKQNQKTNIFFIEYFAAE